MLNALGEEGILTSELGGSLAFVQLSPSFRLSQSLERAKCNEIEIPKCNKHKSRIYTDPGMNLCFLQSLNYNPLKLAKMASSSKPLKQQVEISKKCWPQDGSFAFSSL